MQKYRLYSQNDFQIGQVSQHQGWGEYQIYEYEYKYEYL